MSKPEGCMHSMQSWYIKDDVTGCHDCDSTKTYDNFVKLLSTLSTDDARVRVFDSLFEIFCKGCGKKLTDGKCYCDPIYDI